LFSWGDVLEPGARVFLKFQLLNLKLIHYPADLVIGYLRHAHHQFIKVRLPFILQLLDQTDFQSLNIDNVAHDLKLIFPDFAQDFIWHVYEEEDELFSYIELLIQAIKGKAKLSQVYYAMEKQSINHFANEHEIHKNEMLGLRELTNGFTAAPESPLSIKVLYAELAMLEKELELKGYLLYSIF
jgi:regulator of cell morphogenesis and NO signaling